MLVAEVAEAIVVALNTSSPGNWDTGYEVAASGGYITAEYATDPFIKSSRNEVKLFVIPTNVEYTANEEVPRTGNTKFTELKIVTVMLVIKMDEPTETTRPYDVTTVEAGKVFHRLRERIDRFIKETYISGAPLRTIDAVPADEIQLKERYYVTISQFGYETDDC